MKYLSENYVNRIVGANERTVAIERIATPAEKKEIDAFVDAMIAGKAPVRLTGVASMFDLERNEILESISAGMDPKHPKRRKFRQEYRKLRRRDFLAVKIRTRNDLCQEMDEDGNEVKPVLRVVLTDGSALECYRAWRGAPGKTKAGLAARAVELGLELDPEATKADIAKAIAGKERELEEA